MDHILWLFCSCRLEILVKNDKCWKIIYGPRQKMSYSCICRKHWIPYSKEHQLYLT